MLSDDEIYQAFIDKYLAFYESLRLKERRPKTKEQREFQDAAWGVKEPQSDHKKAYVRHLKRTIGWELKPATGYHYHFPESDFDFGKKWDSAAENMGSWKSWHD